MKKIFLPIIAFVLSATLALSGCGKEKVGVYMTRAEAKDVTYSRYTDITVALDGASIKNETLTKNGNVVVTKEVEGLTYYGVFNVFDAKYIYKLERVVEIIIIVVGEKEDVFKVKYDVDGNFRCKIIRQSGEVVYENLEEVEFAGTKALKKVVYEAWKFKKDGFENFEVIKTKNGKKTVNYSTNNAIGKEITPTDYVWGGMFSTKLVDYVLMVRELANGNSLYMVVNKKGKVVAEYEVDVANLHSIVLVGSSLIVQYVYPVDAYATNFDFLEYGNKKNLETIKVNIKTGKTKKLSNVKCLIDSEMSIGENFASVGINKIENKMLGSSVDAFIDENGKIIEEQYAYDNFIKVSENKLVAENANEEMSIFQIINSDGRVLTDLTASNANYDYVTHCDKFIVIKDAITNKYAMIDLNGKLLTAFVYDESFGVVNDVWLASKKTENTSELTKTITYYQVDAKGVEVKLSQKKTNLEDVVTSNILGEKAIVGLGVVNELVAVVKTNSEQVGLFNYALYAFNDFTTPLTTFANLNEFNIEVISISSSHKQILVVANGKVGILR